MALTQAQQAIVARSQAVGGGAQGVALDAAACNCLVAIIAKDLGIADKLLELDDMESVPPFFSVPPEDLRLGGLPFLELFERLIELERDADTYFACLAALHKARLKYQRILQTQPIPTIDQVGPRGLLQYGGLSPGALTAFLFWRKWMFDIDNRAGQETGYLFEPILASAIGGVPVPAARSPIRRRSNPSKGRQVDCVRANKAYEFKIRVTIAASGQGRWREEIEFPGDCSSSGYTPVLVVLDPTPNPKLTELANAFRAEAGEIYIGDAAWSHLEDQAGQTMSVFLERYVRHPLQALLEEVPDRLPELTLKLSDSEFVAALSSEALTIARTAAHAEDLIDNEGDSFDDDEGRLV